MPELAALVVRKHLPVPTMLRAINANLRSVTIVQARQLLDLL